LPPSSGWFILPE